MDKQTARKVAQWYDSADHSPRDVSVSRAYSDFKAETLQQFDTIRATGFRFDFTRDDPYNGSAELFAAYDCGGIKVFMTDASDLPDDHPMREPVDRADCFGLCYNDIFRAVHDYYGHCQNRYSFGPNGEDNAYRYHRQMYTESARPALAAETRGQNSWFNFGPYSEQPVQSRPFSEQKALAAPTWVVNAE